MNFVNGKLSASGDKLVFKEMEGGNVECRFADTPAVRAFVGKDVILGVRPENLRAASASAPATAGNQFQAVVDIVEPMGAETNIYLQTGAHTMISRNDASQEQHEVGKRVRFEIDMAKVYMFDPVGTGRIV